MAKQSWKLGDTTGLYECVIVFEYWHPDPEIDLWVTNTDTYCAFTSHEAALKFAQEKVLAEFDHMVKIDEYNFKGDAAGYYQLDENCPLAHIYIKEIVVRS